MSDALPVVDVPSEGYQAADWLRARHPWLDQLARRITGTGITGSGITGSGDRGLESDGGQSRVGGDWLDQMAGAVSDCVNHAQAWREYEARQREPDDEGAYVAWLDAGPANTVAGAKGHQLSD